MANLNLAQKTVEYVQLSSAISAQAMKEAAARAAEKAAADKLIPEAVEALLAADCIPPSLTKEAADSLRSHERTLEILLNTIQHLKAASTNGGGQHLGEQYGGSGGSNGHHGSQKRSSVARGDINSPYCGVRTTEKRASDLNFEIGVLGRPAANE